MAEYTATVSWQRDGKAFVDNRYHRAHTWTFDGGAVVGASASPGHVPKGCADPAAVDPEEAFVAALSSCHMLFFLYLAAKGGWTVESYVDEAVGVMGADDAGRQAITRVTLRPRVHFAEGSDAPDAAAIDALHHAAHESCYLANSVRSDVVVEARY